MNFATTANIVTVAFCLAVLVQSVRMMRSLKAVKEGALTEVVGALDASTAEARAVLSELKAALMACPGIARVLGDGKGMIEELDLMIGIANASAERLMEAAANATRSGGDEHTVEPGDDHGSDAAPDVMADAAEPQAVAA